MDRYTLLHLQGGLIAAIALTVLVEMAIHLHPALAVAVGGWLFGWGIERYQAIRREGDPSKRDIVATAAPFQAVAVLLWLFI